MAGNPSDGFRESSLLPRKRGRPKSNTGPIVCENASSNSSGTGSSAPRQLGQDENHITDTNEFCEETMSDTTLRKRGRPLGCTDPGHNQMCGVRGDENSLKYGIQDQMNLGVGTNRPVHQPRIPLIDITKNVASANWNSEAGRNPSPDSSRVEDDPLSGSNSQIVEVKKRGRPKKNHDIPVPSTNWTPGSGGNPSPHNERVVDDPLSGVTNIGSNSKIVEMKGRGRPRKNKAMPDAGAKLAWTSAHPGDLSAGGGLMGAGTFLTPEAGGNPSPNNHSVEDDPRSGVTNIGSNSKIVEMKRRGRPRKNHDMPGAGTFLTPEAGGNASPNNHSVEDDPLSGVTNIGSNSKIVEMKRRGRPKKNRDMPGEPVTNRFCDDSDRPVIPHQMNQLLGTNRLNYAPRIPLNDITHDGFEMNPKGRAKKIHTGSDDVRPRCMGRPPILTEDRFSNLKPQEETLSSLKQSQLNEINEDISRPVEKEDHSMNTQNQRYTAWTSSNVGDKAPNELHVKRVVDKGKRPVSENDVEHSTSLHSAAQRGEYFRSTDYENFEGMPDYNPDYDSDINDPFDYVMMPCFDSGDDLEHNQDYLFNQDEVPNRSESAYEPHGSQWDFFGDMPSDNPDDETDGDNFSSDGYSDYHFSDDSDNISDPEFQDAWEFDQEGQDHDTGFHCQTSKDDPNAASTSKSQFNMSTIFDTGRRHLPICPEYRSLGGPSAVCVHCSAAMWDRERVNKGRRGTPLFSMCCGKGQIQLPKAEPTPPYLLHLHQDKEKSPKFRRAIRAYNAMLNFSSIGGKIDRSINKGRGPNIFRMTGINHHKMGSLLPSEGEAPKFCQLYIYDTENEIENRMKAINVQESEVIHRIDVASLNK